MDKELLGNDNFKALCKTLADDFGVPNDDSKDETKILDGYIEDMGDVNFYTCTVLMILDPNQDFETVRSNLKMFLLPSFQIIVPFGMCWYFLVQKALIEENGYCCDHANPIFRFVGFVTFMYSAWQIIDGCDDTNARAFLKKSAIQWSRTGLFVDLKATIFFYMGYVSQQLCAIMLLILTYVIYTTQCDSPLDLLMNCVAINFVLDIDSEWMTDSNQSKSQTGALTLFKFWRDCCTTADGAEIKKNIENVGSLRRGAPKIVHCITNTGNTIIWVVAYLFVFGWTFCPAEY